MNNVFIKYRERFALVFLDGILIYSENEEEHVEHLRLTLKLIRKHKLYARLSNCDFYEDRIHYLGLLISNEGISGDPEKIQSMIICPAPNKLTYIRSFVGLAGYCRKLTKEDYVGKVNAMYMHRKLACELVVP